MITCKRWKGYRLAVLALAALMVPPTPSYAESLSVTAGSVIPDAGFQFVDGRCGETITAGQTLYLKESDGLYWKADSDLSAA